MYYPWSFLFQNTASNIVPFVFSMHFLQEVSHFFSRKLHYMIHSQQIPLLNGVKKSTRKNYLTTKYTSHTYGNRNKPCFCAWLERHQHQHIWPATHSPSRATVYPQVCIVLLKIIHMKKLYTPDFTNRFNDKRLEKRGFSWFIYLLILQMSVFAGLVLAGPYKRLFIAF